MAWIQTYNFSAVEVGAVVRVDISIYKGKQPAAEGWLSVSITRIDTEHGRHYGLVEDGCMKGLELHPKESKVFVQIVPGETPKFFLASNEVY